MRTQQDILNRIKEIEDDDFFGAIRSDLIQFLIYENAKTFLKEGVTKEEWSHSRKDLTREGVIAEISKYMPFAWDKANNCRGLSAGRSIDHMKAYLWLLEDTELLQYAEDNYTLYGKPILKKICEKYGIEWKSLHSGYAGNDEESQRLNDLSTY